MRPAIYRSTVLSPSLLGSFAILLILVVCIATAAAAASPEPSKQLLLPKQLRRAPAAPTSPTSPLSSSQASVQANLQGNNFLDFEDGTEGAPIRSTVPGVQFITTQGFDWVYGDWRTGNYNGKYPNGSYYSNGNFFAWLGPNQGAGKIDFTNDDGTYARIGVSTYSGVYLDAFDTQGNLIDRAFTGNNVSTGQLTFIEVHAPPGKYIDYLLVHDTGNYWLIDDLTTNASGVGTPPDLSVTSVELNQAVRGTSAFVANRPGVARVTIDTGGPDEVAGVSGTLDAFKDGAKVASFRAGPRTAKKSPTQQDVWAGWNTLNIRFTLGPGTYSFRVTLDQAPGETRIDNNEFAVPGTFEFQVTKGVSSDQRRLRLHVVAYGHSGANNRPDRQQGTAALEGLTRMFPLQDPAYQISTWDNGKDIAERMTAEELQERVKYEELNVRLHNRGFKDWDHGILLFAHDLAPGDPVNGYIAGKTITYTPCAFPIPDLTCGALHASGICIWPGSQQPLVAHEVSHCFNNADENPAVVVEAGAFDPFNMIPADVVPGTGQQRIGFMYHSLVTDNTGWVTKEKYETLFRWFDGALPTSQGAAFAERSAGVKEQATAEDQDFIAGAVTLNSAGIVGLDPLLRFHGTCPGTTFSGGPYTLEMLAEDGTSTVAGSFDLVGDVPAFLFFLPAASDAVGIRVTYQGTEVVRRNKSANAPQVHLDYPNGGEELDGEARIRWTGSDVDGDTLSYTLLYSSDDGNSWDLVETGITGSSTTVDIWNLKGAPNGLFRVMASDGFLTGADDSDAGCVIPGKQPVVVIVPGAFGDSVAYGEQSEFTAQAFDQDDGAIPEELLHWFSSIDGEVAIGPLLELAALSPGEHQLSVSATDSDGNSTTATRNLVVVDAVPPTVTLSAPNGRESLCSAEPFRVTWTANDDDRVDHVELALSLDGGAAFPIAIGPPAAGASDFLWTPPVTAAEHCRVRIRAFDPSGNVSEDISNSEFVITVAPTCLDVFPPQRVTALSATTSPNCVRLLWEAPLDSTLRPLCSGECSPWGQASSGYQIRYASTPILNEADFSSATPIMQVPVPSAPGDLDSVAVCGLSSGLFYFFAVRAVDASDNESPFDTLSIFVPVSIRADAGSDSTVECAGGDGGRTPVRLNGSRSSGTDLRFGWTATNVAFDDSTLASPTGLFASGTTQVVLMVSDGVQSAMDTVYVTVQDTTPPSVTMSMSIALGWPPNHKMIPIHVDLNVHDACDASPSVQLLSITSSEPDDGLGDGDQPNDVQGVSLGTPDRDFLLRAERSGAGNGRVYVICYDVADHSGNQQRVCGTVIVPHDQGGRAGSFWASDRFNLTLFGTPQLPVGDVVRDSIEIGTDAYYRVPVIADASSVGDIDGDHVDDLSLSIGGLSPEQVTQLKNASAVYARWGSSTYKYVAPVTPVNVTAVDANVDGIADTPRVLATQGPAGGVVSLRYFIPQAGVVRFVVYDVAGHAVARLADGLQTAGTHDVRFGGGKTRISSGVYLYRLEWRGKSIAGKVVLIR